MNTEELKTKKEKEKMLIFKLKMIGFFLSMPSMHLMHSLGGDHKQCHNNLLLIIPYLMIAHQLKTHYLGDLLQRNS